ncbi:hypothetical protein AMIS_20000 [Actinoplanes missouriensis 431]|uniref:Uncharacterized protein n=1 Tax=Actinoplanes missouriensis (strain ATCC 14538 / DSM 43046 / CBS 188.64 / JCM 3121 / NBRC 102363 / NCIMB 12654 / NRRL B-3342 / UNCC 431) TaxID=512565 RepID=I0H2I3_ACTM4|nr:hypothetical protein [Actinoplanes missouriensis]BAL87220.1 hypothetical protein AMIS_20000 [Actinoplanes missouriensis 431]
MTTQYVIVHRRDTGRTVEEQVHDIHPDSDLTAATEHAAELQYNANHVYGRTRDTYRVARLAYIDEEG